MKYTQLPQSYIDDTLAEAIYSREVEYFHYDFDRINFAKLLEDIPEGAYRTAIEERLASTLEQMKNVESVYKALLSHIKDENDYNLAVMRTTAKRERQNVSVK